MYAIPTFGLGVIASPTFTSVFDDSLTFPTIQVFDTEAEFIDQTTHPTTPSSTQKTPISCMCGVVLFGLYMTTIQLYNL